MGEPLFRLSIRRRSGGKLGTTTSNVRSDDSDFFAADARELYRHADEPIFLFLIVGGEGVLVHDDNRGVRCAACPRKVWKHLFDSSNELGFLLRKFGRVPARHDQHLNLT
jgi:hypothetical protein